MEAILQQVRTGGDEAVLALSEKFDGVRPDPLRIPRERLERAWKECAAPLRQALELAHGRILAFHQRQWPADLDMEGPMANDWAAVGGRCSGQGSTCRGEGRHTRARC